MCKSDVKSNAIKCTNNLIDNCTRLQIDSIKLNKNQNNNFKQPLSNVKTDNNCSKMNDIKLSTKLNKCFTSFRCETMFSKMNKRIKRNQLILSSSSKKFNSSSYLLNSSYISSLFNYSLLSSSNSLSFNYNLIYFSSYFSNLTTKATKPNKSNFSSLLKRINFASYLILILFCLINILTNNGVLAASTQFDYQNNQLDNSIVYQDATGGVSDLHIECNSNMIVLVLNTQNEQFNGLIYPKGLSKNSTCMVEYNNQIAGNITYILPLRSCNTMSTDTDDGVEYFNTIVVQPHRRLVTNQGKGYHIRCRYQTKEKSITNFLNLTTIGNVPVTASAPIPLCNMKIFAEDSDTEIFVAENVKIGDKLKLEIKIEEQLVYGMKVTNCIVRDGLNWAEQVLLNDDGCPIDEEILGQFKYNKNLTKATVLFQAHKFPYTSSVYYQCNVKLCLKQANGCIDTPPNCSKQSFRKRRDLNKPSMAALQTDEIKELSVEVYSGLYVNEADSEEEGNLLPPKKIVSEEEFCISMRKFLIGVLIASMLLMTAVVLLVACILQRRRRRKHISTTCSSIYSGPYSNRGFLS